ncbi:MAG TPA: hypothetical protein VGH28_05105 [Polyangiaceae bacterium]|jgi:hypothetical protein
MFPYQVEPPRPPGPSTGLKVLAIIQIIFGAFGLLAAPVGIVLAFVNAASKDPVQRRLHELMWEGPVGAWSYAAQAFALIFGIALLAGGIGVVRGKRWGRTASLVYAIGTLVTIVITQAVLTIAVYPELFDMMSSATTPVQRAGAMGGLLGGIGGAVFSVILPSIVLIVMARRATREQLV